MAKFTLETVSFGSQLFLKSSPNRIVHTFSRATITNGVKLELVSDVPKFDKVKNTKYSFAVSVRRNKDRTDGLSYEYSLDSVRYEIKTNSEGIHYCEMDITEGFDECPRGTWQVQLFLKNDITGLTEQFIYIDVVFTNVLRIRQEVTYIEDVSIEDNFRLSSKDNIIINNATGNLYYTYIIYRFINNKYQKYYTSKTYPIIGSMLHLNWQEIENSKTIEKHILTGLNTKTHIYVSITTDSKQAVDLPEFTYLKYELDRSNNLQIVGGDYVDLGSRDILPILPLKLRSKFEPEVIPFYNIKCDWLLLADDNSIRRTLLTSNFDSKIANTKTVDGVKPDIVIEDILKIEYFDESIWYNRILPEYYLGEFSNKVLIKVTITGFDNSGTDLNNQIVSIDEAICNFVLTRTSEKLIINVKDKDLGEVEAAPEIEYIIKDSSKKSKKIIVKEVTDITSKEESLLLKQFTINELNSKIIYNADPNKTVKFNNENFTSLKDGKHTYSIYYGDGVNEPQSVKFNFIKKPNVPSEIIGPDNSEIEEVYAPKEIKYIVSDAERGLLNIKEYFNEEKINDYDFNFSETPVFEERAVTNYDVNFRGLAVGDSFSISIVVNDGFNITEKKYRFKKIKSPNPIITSEKTDLGMVYIPKPLKYTAVDPGLKHLYLEERFDNIILYSNDEIDKIDRTIDYSEQFKKAAIGQHSIVITVTGNDPKIGSQTTRRQISLEKIDNTIGTKLITPLNIGNIVSELNIDLNVWNLIGNKMTYDVELNGNLIITNHDFVNAISQENGIVTYRLNYKLTSNMTEFEKLPENNILKITIIDSDKCSKTLLYTFKKVYKNPLVTVQHDKGDMYKLEIKDQIVECYNLNTANLVIKLNNKEIEFDGKTFIEIPPNVYDDKYHYSFTLSKEMWNSIENYSKNELTFILTDTVTKQMDLYSYIFVKGHQDVITWKPSVSDVGIISWSVDDSLEIPEPMNIRGDDGFIWRPTVNSNGDLSWEKNPDDLKPATINIKGPKGDPGKQSDMFGMGTMVSETPPKEKNVIWVHLIN